MICFWALSLNVMAQQSCPQVIPALREWKGSRGSLAMPSEGNIIVQPADTAVLLSVAETLASDLHELFGWNYRVGTGRPSKADIVLSLMKPDRQLGNEGYTMAVRRDVRISAPTRQGVFWGTRSLLQMIATSDGTLVQGTARDWPDYPNRGFMLDVARKFFTIDYLRQTLKTLSFYKMNELQVHLNDNGFLAFFDNDWDRTYSAFRLESERFPGLTAKDGSYTKQEFVDLQKLGEAYGVNIIPEIDIPAHSLAFAHYKPEIGSAQYGMDHLDLFKPETYEFVNTLLDEYLGGDDPVFRGPDVHIGTDEYHADVAEQFRAFTDRYLKYVTGYGKQVRMWGSLRWIKGKTPVTSDNVTINAWSYDWIDPNQSLKDGYKLINTCDSYLYIVPGAGYYRDFLDTRWLYNEWRVGKINGREELPEHTPGLLGGMFAVWNDICGNGVSQQDVHLRTVPAVQVMAEKMWRGRNEAVPFETFEALTKRMPEAPGVDLLARVEPGVKLPGSDETLALTGKDSICSPLNEVGYPYKVEFEICPAKQTPADAVLFRSDRNTVLTNWGDKGKIAFCRDGYTFVFHGYTLPEEQWTKIRIEGDRKGTSLYVGDKLVERLEGRVHKHWNDKHKRLDAMYMQETLVFPLRHIGDPRNGFRGSLRGLRYEQGDDATRVW